MQDDLHRIGQQLREARKQRNLRQQEVARHLKTQRQYISDMERGVYKGVLPPLLNYLHFLGLSLTANRAASMFPQLSELDSLFAEDDEA